jgi:hypothetical protein
MTLDDLREFEAAKYDIQWQEPWYREKCHGLALWAAHRNLFPDRVDTAIDYGSGTGRLVKMWRSIGIEAKGVDISTKAADPDIADHVYIGCMWESTLLSILPRFEVGICADVMEHIPPHKVEDVLTFISETCAMCVFKIANFPSVHDGRELHLTLKPRDWWERVLSQFGTVEFIPTQTGVEEYVFRVHFNREANQQ